MLEPDATFRQQTFAFGTYAHRPVMLYRAFSARRRDRRRFIHLLAAMTVIACAACGVEDPRSELLEIAAASDPGERSRELTACMYDSLLERHGSEAARQLVEMARAKARGDALPSDARAVLALSLQEAVRCTERRHQEQGAPHPPSRETRISRGTHS